jgi:ribosome-associated protein
MITAMHDEIVSKTRRKKEMLELQALGVALVELPESQLLEMSLEDGLREAIIAARRITSHEARRRQMQYIGRLMREIDPAPVRARLEAISSGSAQSAARHRRLEAWRERLLADDGALTAFATEHPGADFQALRALIRNSRKQLKQGNRARAYRELFRLIKQCYDSNPS